MCMCVDAYVCNIMYMYEYVLCVILCVYIHVCDYVCTYDYCRVLTAVKYGNVYIEHNQIYTPNCS